MYHVLYDNWLFLPSLRKEGRRKGEWSSKNGFKPLFKDTIEIIIQLLMIFYKYKFFFFYPLIYYVITGAK